jgi:hypothetical protein
MMNISRCSRSGSSYVTFMNRRATPVGKEITS